MEQLPGYHTRLATPADTPALAALIDASIRHLGGQFYDAQQVASSLRYLFGVDTLLIEDGTYIVVERDGHLVGAGGWSRRKTPFGGDNATAAHDPGFRNPATDPAVIRAFYVHPAWARRGLGRHLLRVCETAAHAAGFQRLELVSTLSGRDLYEACGYRITGPIAVPLPDGTVMDGYRMAKP